MLISQLALVSDKAVTLTLACERHHEWKSVLQCSLGLGCRSIQINFGELCFIRHSLKVTVQFGLASAKCCRVNTREHFHVNCGVSSELKQLWIIEILMPPLAIMIGTVLSLSFLSAQTNLVSKILYIWQSQLQFYMVHFSVLVIIL